MDSPRLRMLSGAEIVDRGRNVTDTQLPEAGAKETTATGSWLEQKQVQAALEARKALVAVERIDKIGCLSHAEWCDTQKLAEVTQQIGGYWQYLGHKVNGTFYLLPEEALYLMETNCLLLKHNNVTVSLQKAYSLLLDDEMTLTQYKVYASLSRVGYKVFRHDRLKISLRKGNESNINNSHSDLQQDNNAMEVSNKDEIIANSKMASQNPVIKSVVAMNTDAVMLIHDEKPEGVQSSTTGLNSASKTSIENPGKQSLIAADTNIPTEGIIIKNIAVRPLLSMATDVVMNLVTLMDKITETANFPSTKPLQQSKSNAMALSEPKDLRVCIRNEVQALSTDKSISPSEMIFSVDENGVVRLGPEDNAVAMETDPSPSIAGRDEITNDDRMEIDINMNENDNRANKPNNKAVRLNSYIVKKLKIQNRNVQSSDPISMHDRFKDIPNFYKQQIVTVNVPSEDYLPRNVFLNNTSYVVDTNKISHKPQSRSSTHTQPAGNRSMYRTIRNSIESENAAVPTPETSQFIPNTPPYDRPYGYYPNWRPHIRGPFYQQPRFNQHPYFYRVMNSIPQNVAYVPRPPFNLNQIDRQKVKDDHLHAIRSLARSLNHVSPNNYHNLKISINGLISRFNKIYGEKLIITQEHHIINTKQGIETIEIQDDEVVVEDKQKKVNKFDQYLANIKVLAARLKNLARKKQPIAKQKRAFSKLLKHFNREYNAELYLDDDGELADRKLVVLDSSDSDVAAVDEIVSTNSQKRKSRDENGTTNKKRKILANPFSVIAKLNGNKSKNASEIPQVASQGIENYFDKNWLPGEDDFGTAVPCSVTDAQHLLYDTQQLYEFMDDPNSFKTWVDLKLTFYTHMEAIFSFEQDLTVSRNITKHSEVKPILQGAVTEDWASSDKLRIIKTNTDIEETSLCVHFDVYKRDVQNFRKTDPPTPHFRIVCIKESSPFPSTAEVRGLHSKYDDNVIITFAVVGIASISYLQIKPTDLPLVDGND